jgi:hypothetical protein
MSNLEREVAQFVPKSMLTRKMPRMICELQGQNHLRNTLVLQRNGNACVCCVVERFIRAEHRFNKVKVPVVTVPEEWFTPMKLQPSWSNGN